MKVVIDEYQLQVYPGHFIVADDNSFVEARKLILDFKLRGTNEKPIAVTSYPYSVWFSDIENEGFIKVEKILPSKKLKEKFKNVQIDKDLEEKDIVFLDLINETIEPTEISILNKYIGSFILSTSDLKQQMYHVTAYAANPPKQFISSKYLQKKWAKYLDKIECESPVMKAVLYNIKEGDPDFCKVINQLIYVSNSQYLLREWIHDNRAYLETTLQRSIQDLEKFLAESKFQVPLNEQYETRIESFYKTLYREDLAIFFKDEGGYKASLNAFLALVKGITIEEKEFILYKYGRYIDFELAERIKSLIKPELISPPKVDELPLTMQIDAWQRWALDSFIPFKFYLDDAESKKEAILVEEFANSYSDWLIKSYSAIIQSGKKTNYNIINAINDELLNYKVIWLIIDGFPAIYVEALNSILKANGINKIQEEYHFAALPTITSIGIPTQLNGKIPQAGGYTVNREEALMQSFESKRIVFKNSVAFFQEALESEYDLCCLHWREIDEFMHKEDNDIEDRRIDVIKRLLYTRVKQIADIIKSNTDKKIKLVISTDHGVTKCLVKGQSIRNSSLMEVCKDNPKERCVELCGSLSNANLDESEIYYLKAEQAFNKTDWAIARGYRYFGRFDYGYRHGGLTPEETIVPFLNCEVSQHEVLPISISYGGLADLQLGFTEGIKLIIKNDNDAVVEVLKVSILEDRNFNIDLSSRVQPFTSRAFDGKIKLSKTIVVKNGKAQLNVSVRYSVFGEERNITAALLVPIKKSVNESLDNLFS